MVFYPEAKNGEVKEPVQGFSWGPGSLYPGIEHVGAREKAWKVYYFGFRPAQNGFHLISETNCRVCSFSPYSLRLLEKL